MALYPYYPQYARGNPYGTLGPSPATVRSLLPKRRKPAPTRSANTLTQDTLTSLLANIPSVLTDEQARDRAMSLLQPIFDAEDQRLNAAYNARRNAVQAAYAQLAQYAQGVSPAIQQAYSGAAKDTAAFGKGFSDAVQQASQGQADTATAALAAQGSPQTVTSGLTGGGADALYAMGGQIPASALSREGAAFGSAAAFLPTTAANYGAQAIGDLESQRTQDLADLVSQRPSTVLDLINQLVGNSSDARQNALSQAIDQRNFNYQRSQDNRAFNYSAKQDRLSRKDAAAKTRQDNIDRQYEAAALKQAYGYPLTARDKRLLNTYGTTPEAVKTAGDAKLERQDDARSRAAQTARDNASAARQAASDARRAKLQAQTAAERSGLEKDKAKYRMALERYKAAQRKALAAQKTANAATKKTKKKKRPVGNPGDSASNYFGG